MIFSRRNRAGRHARPDEPARLTPAEKRREQRAELLRDLDLEPQQESVDRPRQAATSISARWADGPFDFDDAPPSPQLVDLGSLLVPPVEGIEIGLQATENGVLQQIVLVHGPSALHIAAFAAPRTDGLWDEVRAETRKALFDDGVGAEEIAGRWGTELRARLRTDNGFDDLRFVGIDGPRWMVRAVFRGPAALDPEQAAPLYECLTGLVVRRDDQARPTREPLPLRMPGQGEAQEQTPVEPAPVAAQAPRRKPSPRPRRD